MRALPTVLFVILPAVLLASPPLPRGVAEVCAGADLIVLGALQNLKPFAVSPTGEVQDPFGDSAEIAVKEVLFGRAEAGPLPIRINTVRSFRAEASGDLGPPKLCPPLGVDPEDVKGPRIWCLSREKGVWFLQSPDEVLAPEKRGEAEKAVEKRLEPSRKVLEESAYYHKDDGLAADGPKPRKSDELDLAYEKLAAAGPAGSRVAQTLLGDARPGARACGCCLAGMLRDMDLLERILGLIEDGGKARLFDGCCEHENTVGAVALETLQMLANRPLKTAAEAKPFREAFGRSSTLGLSAEGKRAYETLLLTDVLANDAVGDGGDLPETAAGFRVLLKEGKADAAFKQLLKDGGTAGQLYALCGIFFTDPEAFPRLVEPRRKDKAKVNIFFGCSKGQREAGEIVETEILKRELPKRLKGRSAP